MIQQFLKRPKPDNDDKDDDDCPVCRGTGKVGRNKDIDCGACEGSGRAK